MIIKNFIKDNFGWFYCLISRIVKNYKYKKDAKRLDSCNNDSTICRVFYLGITAHSNLGDMAQHYCILKWIKENYPNYELLMFESDTVVWESGFFIKKFKKVYRPCDVIIFQSGYTTQDLGGNHEYMHRLIVDNMPLANILMMPQTIFFEHEENKRRCSKSLDKAKHMLFLARDFYSERIAKEMFPHLEIKAFPDIVTTLIGTFSFQNERKGICMCCRNDVEKFYSDDELVELKKRFELLETVDVTDTTISVPYKDIRNNPQYYIEAEIEKFSHYKVVVTDRYHGTIFSIAAGTPVVILKTTDHKVVTGADWFKGIYDGNVCVASDLNEAYMKAMEFIKNERNHMMPPYFKQNYYDKLKSYFEDVIKK